MNRPDMTMIYKEYHDKVMGYIFMRLRSQADAEDLCQDVFEKIHVKLESFDATKASLSTWIYTITRNSVIDFYRRSRPFAEIDENIPDDSAVDEELLNDEALEELAEALTKLPAQLREIVVLHYYDGLPLTEIGQRMNLSYGAIKIRHAKALMQLRTIMG